MSKKSLIIYFLLLSTIVIAQNDLSNFNRGINLTGWFQANSSGEIQFNKYTKEDLMDIKSLGVDVIRLPINLQYMTNGEPDYIVDNLFYEFMDDVVKITTDLNISLILDNHTFDPSSNTPTNIEEILTPIWKQLAEHYKNSSPLVYYELLNEPHGISASKWNNIQTNLINEIRKIDSIHTIIVGPVNFNSYNDLGSLPTFNDDKILYTFHFYDPFVFTHQGASWVSPSMVPLANIPFPYNSSTMPTIPSSFNGTWVGSSLANYKNEGNVQHIQSLIKKAVNFSNSRKVDIFCGEFGVLMDNAPSDDRVFWYSEVRKYLEQNNIPWTIWDYHGGFGLFEKNSPGFFDHNLNISLVEALGFNIPAQTDFTLQADSNDFYIYQDYAGRNISTYGSGLTNFYSSSETKKGKFNISWSGASQYQEIKFDFSPIRDFSYLIQNNYYIGFWVKASNTQDKLHIRFTDTKSADPNDHPWRMNYELNSNIFDYDNNWHYVEIPLILFTEGGSWDNNWYNPENKFDWANLQSFSFVSEFDNLKGTFQFDEIRIYDPNLVSVKDYKNLPLNFHVDQNYPNPFNPSTTISFQNGKSGIISVNIYNSLGQIVETLTNKNYSVGSHSIIWDATGFPSGIYFYTINFTSNKSVITTSRKMILLK